MIALKKFFLITVILPLIICFTVPIVLGLCVYSPAIGKSNSKAPSNDLFITVLDCESKKVRSVSLEEYLPGVVAAEMPAAFEVEALKAQSVAARSYILSKLKSTSDRHPSAAVCSDPSHCKAYIAESDVKKLWGESKADFYLNKIKECCNATRGEYMTYENEAIEAFFFSQSGGRTENAKDVWGTDLPYLKSVESTENPLNPNYKTTAEFSFSDFRKKLNTICPEISANSSPPTLGSISRTTGGSVDYIEIDGEKFKGTNIRKLFNLRSANFEISIADAKVIFTVTGYGHGVGMSQYGANEMAKKGENYTEILSHYYTNIQIMRL